MDEEDFTFFDNSKPEEWELLTLQRGQVIEAEVDVSENPAEGSVWAGFLVQKVELTIAGEMVVTVRSLGSEDAQATKRMSSLFNRRRGTIHLCSAICAGEDIYALHIGSFRTFDLVNFRRSYITPSVRQMIKKWEKEIILVEDDGDNIDLTGTDQLAGKVPGRVETSPKAAAPPGDSKLPAAGKAAPKRRAAEKEEAGVPNKKIDRAKLRERLARAKEKLAGSAIPDGAGIPALPPRAGGDGEADEASSSEPYSASVGEDLPRELAIGTELEALEDGTPGGARLAPADRDKAKKRKKEKKRERDLSGLGSGVLARVATRGITSGALQEQLLHRAAEAVTRKEAKKKDQKKKHKKKNAEKRLIQILTKKDKKEKKSKKRKKRPGPGSSGDPGNSGSPTNSSDENSSGPLEESSGSESANLEAPLRKKSREKPGSVLALLVEHARQQLDQTSKVAIQPNLKLDPTKGVRISSYFSIVVRPQLGAVNAQIRELHHLSSAIDALRQGDLDILGDLLASRFIAIHQSMIDNSWTAARHLELLPLEENSAAGSGVLLEARKYAKLNAKLNNQEQWGNYSYGKGRGGKGRPYNWNDNSWQATEQKGKGKKGSKGKNKGKNQWQGSQGRGAEADGGRQKEVIPEK